MNSPDKQAQTIPVTTETGSQVLEFPEEIFNILATALQSHSKLRIVSADKFQRSIYVKRFELYYKTGILAKLLNLAIMFKIGEIATDQWGLLLQSEIINQIPQYLTKDILEEHGVRIKGDWTPDFEIDVFIEQVCAADIVVDEVYYPSVIKYMIDSNLIKHALARSQVEA